MPEKPAGKVEHYYPKVQAAAVKLSKKVKVGDEVHIVGHGDDFKEKVTSLQLDRQPIQEGQPGQSVGLWVKERVHEGDDVLLVEPDRPRKAPARPSKLARKATKDRSKRAKASKKAAKKAGRKGKKAAKRFGKALARSQARSRKATRKAAKKRR